MKISLKWLKDYINIEVTPDELCQKMTMAGFEVEGVEDAQSSMHGIVVGRIEKLTKHPNADKLQICDINIGKPLQIITGATNVFEGALIPVATDNSLLPTGKVIKTGKLRDVLSEGMLCSGEELLISEDEYPGAGVNGILILKEDYPLGTDVREIFGRNDCVIDFSVTPNRPDCNSVTGLAREIAAVLRTDMHLPEAEYTAVQGNTADICPVEVRDGELCPRYMLRAVKNIKIASSPKWMQDRLRSAGLRPINNIVDITNYILLETGHPMHAFDKRDITGGITVRRAHAGESITTLDEKEHALTEDMLVIADDNGPAALAGIMGGANSGIKDDTVEVLFECAKFKRDNIRRTARTLGMRSDSSSLFEKGVDAYTAEYALNRACRLVCELNAGQPVSGTVDIINGSIAKSRSVTVSASRICGLLGITVPTEEMLRILNSLEIPTVAQGDSLIMEVPSYRDDIECDADVAEEVIRIYGYEHITDDRMKADMRVGSVPPNIAEANRVSGVLVGNRCREICTYSFVSPKTFDMLSLPAGDSRRLAATLLNPLGEEYSVMRTSLYASMLSVIALNQNHGTAEARLFETSMLHFPKQLPMTELPEERLNLCIAAYGKNEDFFTLKSLVESVLADCRLRAEYKDSNEPFLHPYRQARIYAGRTLIGTIGEVHPKTLEKFAISGKAFIAQIDLKAVMTFGKKQTQYKTLPKYPTVQRDLAVTVDESIPAGDMLAAINSAGGHLLKNSSLFDVYRSELLGINKKSMAFSLEFRADDRTLTIEEVNDAFEKIVSTLAKRFDARIR